MQPKDTFFSRKSTLNLKGRLFNFDQPKLMGIINVTDDSFYQASRAITETNLLTKAEIMLSEGADWLDLGAYSTRPNAPEVPIEQELERIIWASSLIKKHFPDTLLSIDTFRANVAKAGVEQGALMINDVSGGQLDADMWTTVAQLKVPYVLMHMRGDPQTMQSQTHYNHLLTDILDYFQQKLNTLANLGVYDVVLDVGFGFAKTTVQNYDLLKNLRYFEQLNAPLMAGLSRKSMIWKALDITAEEALNGTSALHMVALMNGAHLLRVHDVKEARQCITLFNALNA